MYVFSPIGGLTFLKKKRGGERTRREEGRREDEERRDVSIIVASSQNRISRILWTIKPLTNPVWKQTGLNKIKRIFSCVYDLGKQIFFPFEVLGATRYTGFIWIRSGKIRQAPGPRINRIFWTLKPLTNPVWALSGLNRINPECGGRDEEEEGSEGKAGSEGMWSAQAKSAQYFLLSA